MAVIERGNKTAVITNSRTIVFFSFPNKFLMTVNRCITLGRSGWARPGAWRRISVRTSEFELRLKEL